jgi:hypothetical protein
VEQAIQACRPESKSLLHNTEQMHKVKETLNDGYCDIQGMQGDLVFVGWCFALTVSIGYANLHPAEILNTRVYAGKGAVKRLESWTP